MDGVAGPSSSKGLHDSRRVRKVENDHLTLGSSSSSNTGSSKSSSTSDDRDEERRIYTGRGWRSHEERSTSKSYRFIGSDEPQEALEVMRQVLDKFETNGVQGPQLFRLDSEFGLELGRGAQFKVLGPTPNYLKKLESALNANPESPLASTLNYLTSSVVKRALWVPDTMIRTPLEKLGAYKLSRKDVTKELNSQLTSAKNEIDRLCHMGNKNHPNIVRLRGWGLCLDTFEATTPLNTRIPLLILERATCDLGDFLASSNYDNTSYEALVKICADIGTGLGGLHRGNLTHGDMKPENVLLFADKTSDPSKTIWTAKLCDFGNAETKDKKIPKMNPRKNDQIDTENISASGGKTFTYDGTYGWTPPEALLDQRFDFEGLKRCDLFVYGLIVWRIFAPEAARGTFDSRKKRRVRLVPPIIEDENKIQAYVRDLAYKEASADIKAALRSSAPGKGPSFELREGLIPDRGEVNRILRVLRASLQPIPRFRDPRPWRYLDRIVHSNIRVVDENPGREAKYSSSPDIVESDSVLPRLDLFGRASQQRKVVSAMTEKYLGPVYSQAKSFFPSLLLKSPHQKVFESIFRRVSSAVPLGWDQSSMAELEHEGSCYDLSPLVKLSLLINRLIDLCWQGMSDQFDEEAFTIYSFARIRSRFKLCCWQKNMLRHQETSLELLLCHGRDPFRLQDAYLFELFIKSVAWLSWGEIGAQEIKDIESTEESASNIWPLTFASGLKETAVFPTQGTFSTSISRILNCQSRLFSLFLERGCYVGREVGGSWWTGSQPRNDTALSKYLSDLVNGSTVYGSKYLVEYEGLVINACNRVMETSTTCLSQALGGNDSVQKDKLRASMRFFFKGESPDISNEVFGTPTDTALMKEIRRTTVLHEAVFSCCYSAVEFFVMRSTIPLMVRDCNRETALDLSLRLKRKLEKETSEDWRLIQLNLIIGLLTRSSKVTSDDDSDLPLGWEKVELGQGLVGFQESTVNPKNPSFTFEQPKFSLLQETQITLGSRKAAEGGLTYKFDLVRFIHSSRILERKESSLMFDESWYRDDTQELENESRSLLALAREELLNGTRFRILKVVLFRNYVNILLIFVPISIVYRVLNGNTPNPATFFCLASFATIPLVDIAKASLSDIRRPGHTTDGSDQTISMRLALCLVEVLIGISALLYHDMEVLHHLIIGSAICNLLLMPGICFTIGGINNTTTGFANGIQQDFNSTALGMVSQLILFGAIFSALLYTFLVTASAPTSTIGYSILNLSRYMSIILLSIFVTWLWFRYRSHTPLFDYENLDGYEDEHRLDEPQLSPWMDLLVILTCLLPLVLQTDSIALSLHLMSPELRKWLIMYLIPILLPIDRHVKAIRLILKDKVDDSLDLSLGFSITLCLFVGPLLVVLSWCLGNAFTLQFDLFGTVAYLFSALLMAYVVANGKSNWLEGVELLIVYAILMFAYAFLEPF